MVPVEGDVDGISWEPGTIAVPVATVVSDSGENVAGPAGDFKMVRTQVFRLVSSEFQQRVGLRTHSREPTPASPAPA